MMSWLAWALVDSAAGRLIGRGLALAFAAGLALLAAAKLVTGIADLRRRAETAERRLKSIEAKRESDADVDRIIRETGEEGLADMLAGRGLDRHGLDRLDGVFRPRARP